MPLAPEAWQEKLERHFSEIAATRPVDQFPVFALEHGLSSEELQEIGSLLRDRVARGLALYPHWLLWVIYATELGYLYDGVDYWPPFERRTPRWREYGSPAQLKEWFKRFQRKFYGVEPSGPWAVHFNRIAWPITHAVLPKLLQVQFAKALFDVSRDIARASDLDPASAGRILARNAYWYSSRFQEFLQQEELAGRIMLAMLDRKPAGGVENPILPITLKRITDDVIKVQAAGEYLRAAQRIVRDRFEGVHRTVVSPLRTDSAEGDRRTAELLALQPSLTLRRTAALAWAPVIEVPSFAGVAQLSSDLTQYLKGTRCSISGVGPTLFPPGFLLYGSQIRALKSWPAPEEPIIKFETPNPTVENLMRRDCRFSSGPVWVFRMGSDGLAREVTGRIVRANQKYVVVSRSKITSALLPLRDVEVACDGAAAVELDMPEFVSPELTQELEKYGILVARNIRIWPTGLCVRNWDGEGHGDWLSTEVPCFGISHDHAVDEYYLKLNNGPETRLEGARARQPIFIRLPHLALGRHIISVRAKRVGVISSRQSVAELEGKIELQVRDPTHWKAGTTSHTGLLVATDPHDPNLDSFWEGNVSVSVRGPEGHAVTCNISLTGPDGQIVLSEEIGKFDLPLKQNQWSHRFREFANDDARAWKYLEASSGQFTIKGNELGQYTLRLERELKPVRWIYRAASQDSLVRLVDDTGLDEQLVAEFYSFVRPGLKQQVDAIKANDGIPVVDPGGLYFAQQSEHLDALVVSSSRRVHGLSELVTRPDLRDVGNEPKELARLLALIELWHAARLAGALADSRRNFTVRCLTDHLNSAFTGGDHWARAEEAFRNDPERNVDRVKAAVGGHGSLAAALLKNTDIVEKGVVHAGKWFCDAAARYSVCKETDLAKFAVRLANSPIGVVSEFGASTEDMLQKLRSMGILFRGARLLAILSAMAEAKKPELQRRAW
jgi:hypothetical protein